MVWVPFPGTEDLQTTACAGQEEDKSRLVKVMIPGRDAAPPAAEKTYAAPSKDNQNLLLVTTHCLLATTTHTLTLQIFLSTSSSLIMLRDFEPSKLQT